MLVPHPGPPPLCSSPLARTHSANLGTRRQQHGGAESSKPRPWCNKQVDDKVKSAGKGLATTLAAHSLLIHHSVPEEGRVEGGTVMVMPVCLCSYNSALHQLAKTWCLQRGGEEGRVQRVRHEERR